MSKFKVGDVVILKSSSPQMTVSELGSEDSYGDSRDMVTCIWFNAGVQMHSIFHQDTLLKSPSADE